MSRHTLHDLVDRIPDAQLSAARGFLEYLAVQPAYRTGLSAPPDDEPVSESDALAIERAGEDAGLRSNQPTLNANITVRQGALVQEKPAVQETGKPGATIDADFTDI